MIDTKNTPLLKATAAEIEDAARAVIAEWHNGSILASGKSGNSLSRLEKLLAKGN